MHVRRFALLVALVLLASACGPVTEQPKQPASAAGEWRDFEGSWNAAGSRRSLSLGADRRSAIIELKGTMLIAGAGRPGVGFRADVIAFTDSATGLVGRGVWTDERGDQVFSELKGEGTAAKTASREQSWAVPAAMRGPRATMRSPGSP